MHSVSRRTTLESSTHQKQSDSSASPHEGCKNRQLPNVAGSKKLYLSGDRAGTQKSGARSDNAQDLVPRAGKLYKAARIFSEVSRDQIAEKGSSVGCQESNSNANLPGEASGKLSSCETGSKVARSSKIPRATTAKTSNAEASGRFAKLKPSSSNAGKAGGLPERKALESYEGSKEIVESLRLLPETLPPKKPISLPATLEPSVSLADPQVPRLSESDSCDSKRSSCEFDDSAGQVSDDEIMDISGDVTIRKEALNIAVKLASTTSVENEDSAALGFPELAMLDILGASDLSLNVPKNDLSFTIFEDMDNITDSSNPINRPRSMEDLPMECEIDSAAAAPDAVTSARSPSPMEELPLSSRTLNAPVSIITSITSIMSLDTGYQGDGELSRPESRSGEVDSRLKISAAENGVQLKSLQFDDAKTMTDSDFFTESDADGHDDLSAAAAEIGSGKGDRKAQVIDGTLYGGVNVRKHNFALGEGETRSHCAESANVQFASNGSNDDMASSGIFSDLEKRPEPGFTENEAVSDERPTEEAKELQNADELAEDKKDRSEGSEGMVKSSSDESSSTIQEISMTVMGSASNVSVQNGERSVQKSNKNLSAKNKMPNRNVTSKVKVLIESSKPKSESRPKTVRKGKWDAVMDRIAQGKEENKHTSTRLRDVKSKVYQNTKPFCAAKIDDMQINKPITSNAQAKARSRRNIRIRSSESQNPNLKKSASPNSSQRSSISDISLAAVKKTKQNADSNQNGIPEKSASITIINSIANSNINYNKHKVKAMKMVQKKTSPVAARSKDSAPQRNSALHIPSKDRTTALLKQLKHNSKAFESLAILLSYCTNDLDAFSTPYLKEALENERRKYAEAQERSEELERHMRQQLAAKAETIGDLEAETKNLNEKVNELTAFVAKLRCEEETLRRKLNSAEEELRMKTKEKEDAEEKLGSENESLLYQLEEANKLYGMLKKLYDKLKSELASERQTNAKALEVRQRKETSPDKGKCEGSGTRSQSCEVVSGRLESEVESLRQVLALKTDEISELRRQELILRENADRVPKLVSTIALLEGKVEDFQTQLSSQTFANRSLEKRNYHLEEELKLANMQKLRLTQKNEELQYKLRQYAEALRQLVSEKNLTEDDIRNEYLYPKTPQKGECSLLVDSLPPQMKGLVQKSDSVSYMLEMTEDSNEIVTNIIRRAESMRYSSRSQTLPKKKRPKTYSVSSVDALSPFEDYCSGGAEKPGSGSTKFPFDKVYGVEMSRTPKSKIVKLNSNDFIPDSIELPRDNGCEIIEITKSFDAEGKSDKGMTEMSLSSCSSSSDSGNNFDIESDIYQNTPELDGEAGEGVFAEKRYLREESPLCDADESAEEPPNEKEKFSSFGNAPKTSGGEALVSSGDEAQASFPKTP